MQIDIESQETGPVAPEEEAFEVPEKFKDASKEDILKSYLLLEKKLSAPKEDEPKEEPKAEEKPAEKVPVEKQDQDVAEALSVAGLDMSTFTKEYDEKGELSEDTYKSLEAAGFPKSIVDVYIDGVKARSKAAGESAEARTEAEVFRLKNSVGGPNSYDAMVQWARANLSEAEINSFNTAISSGNFDTANFAVQGINARYVAARGSDPKLLSGKPAGDESQGFASWAEVQKAMRDPRYGKDAAYMKEVTDRMARSDLKH